MKPFGAALVCLSLCGVPAAGEVWEYGPGDCNALWFSRNLIMDRAGYCFGSALGQSLFNNGDCVGKEVSVGPTQQKQVARIQKLEREIGCKVNTGQRSLDLSLMAQYRRLRDMPLPDNGGAACTWAGKTQPLQDGYTSGSAVIGRMEAGDRVGFGWIGEGAWTVIAVSKGGYSGPTTLGWVNTKSLNFEQSCTDWAG